MTDLPAASALFEPIMSSDEPVGFEEFVDWAISETNSAFSLLREPQDDVAPFAVIAERADLWLVTWPTVDPALSDLFLAHVLPPTLACRDADMAALGITT